jgi:hypothetical protein
LSAVEDNGRVIEESSAHFMDVILDWIGQRNRGTEIDWKRVEKDFQSIGSTTVMHSQKY